CRNWQTFSTNFLKTVNSNLNVDSSLESRLKAEIAKWQPTINLGPITAQRVSQSQTQTTDMSGPLSDLWKKHLEKKVDIVFVMLDDFQYFPLASEDSAYLSLRSLFQELVNQKCNYSLVVTAHSELFTKLADIAEPVLRFFKRFELKPFTYEDAREAIDKRLDAVGSELDVDDGVIRSIVDLTAGHPYILMFTMFELLMKQKGAKRIDNDSFQEAWSSIERDIGETIFSEKFSGASEKERELLLKIAVNGAKEFAPTDFRSVRGVNELCSRLADKELLLKLGRGKYTLFHPLFGGYLNRKARE
ncbi:MAG: hypothetical protein JRN20_23390, partial [Nitrososphaerota archaeon]|nr:hypothetical protein [Nitrososphaerota archaeon]